jgi:hypothetical protein
MNVDYAIEINQCYGQSNATLCAQYPVSQRKIFVGCFEAC